ncbi:hypothetical protein H310_09086 [Aphanomyces invadans]|uniref:Uncharacterized protein n=1 Tax=Aphanomyces invadans TaxID=157072 RepID=A0A024TWN6_9STRA|nr:hypothetical protein H310_09086 [Aphanomyces invadans]ETV98398.1 hypothetical protein H310_09086 [Aphanomyces invadans]RHY28270.1 hypothetical protein DYB32_006915 [Aphanomyces invadans]|eukprot:XP_008873273.1 hypothetical protein H310_09086 [Aphanomyces invadans]
MSYLVPSEYLQKFTPKEIQDLKRVFKQFDADLNGSIDAEELSKLLLSVGEQPSPELVKELIASVDTDHSNTIEFPEFLTLLYELRHPVPNAAPVHYPTGPTFCNDSAAALGGWNTTFEKPASPAASSPSSFAPKASSAFTAAAATFNKGTSVPMPAAKLKKPATQRATNPAPAPVAAPVVASPEPIRKSSVAENAAKFGATKKTTSPAQSPALGPAAHPPVQRVPSQLATIVQKHLTINESHSATGGVHSYSEEEKAAFAEHINHCLSGDDHLPYLPMDTSSNALFTSVTDGILLCKLINQAVPDTIDFRAVNIKAKLNLYEKTENLNLVINAAKSIGCSIVNIGPSDLLEGKPILVLGLVWQLIKIQLTSTINLKNHPELMRLLLDGESLEDFMKLPPDQILLRWVNYHLAAAKHDKKIANFGRDIADATAYSVLLHHIAASKCDLARESTAVERAAHVIRNAEKIGVDPFIKPTDITMGNTKLNLGFVAQLFNTCPALDVVDAAELKDILDDDVGDSREERCFRMWINSLAIHDVYVNHLYSDLKDGLVILHLLDKTEPGVVSWPKANVQPTNKFKKVENCNYCVVLGKQLKFSLVNVGGVDIADGNKKLVLSLIWQLMRHSTIKLLSSLGQDVHDKDIIDWANAKIQSSGQQKLRPMVQFRDLALSDGIYLIDLVYAVEPRAVNWDAVVLGSNLSQEDKEANAKYAISCARKIGATVFLTYEDIVEVKPKMIMTFVASLMSLDKH